MSHLFMFDIFRKQVFKKIMFLGVPIVVQWLTNLTKNNEVAGLIPGLAQWVKDLVFP